MEGVSPNPNLAIFFFFFTLLLFCVLFCFLLSSLCVHTRAVSKALVYLHVERKIHRDVKAGNILVAADGSVR